VYWAEELDMVELKEASDFVTIPVKPVPETAKTLVLADIGLDASESEEVLEAVVLDAWLGLETVLEIELDEWLLEVELVPIPPPESAITLDNGIDMVELSGARAEFALTLWGFETLLEAAVIEIRLDLEVALEGTERYNPFGKLELATSPEKVLSTVERVPRT
jgi:hypothetical protein